MSEIRVPELQVSRQFFSDQRRRLIGVVVSNRDHPERPACAERDRVAGLPVRNGGAERWRVCGRPVFVFEPEGEACQSVLLCVGLGPNGRASLPA
jgi:hypothetical protein